MSSWAFLSVGFNLRLYVLFFRYIYLRYTVCIKVFAKIMGIQLNTHEYMWARPYRRCYSSRLLSAIRPTLLKTGPSVHPKVPWLSPSVPTRPTIAPTLVI
jgi:hypothetical protein